MSALGLNLRIRAHHAIRESAPIHSSEQIEALVGQLIDLAESADSLMQDSHGKGVKKDDLRAKLAEIKKDKSS